MSDVEAKVGHLQRERREEVIQKYRKAALAKEEYLLRRQRKEILEKCRRIAIIGASTDPESPSYVSAEKLLGLGLEIIPILRGCREYQGIPCYADLSGVPGPVDILLVYPRPGVDLLQAAREAVQHKVKAFWVEGEGISPEIKEVLADGSVQVVEHQSLEREYSKHFPFPAPLASGPQGKRRFGRVGERMTRNPVTVTPVEGIREAIEKMKKGHFRHLPVVDEEGKLIGMLSDRDIRLIRPSLAFVSPEDAELQLWSTSVRQAAVFDPVTIYSEALLEQAAELMLRWEVGGLPVVDKGGKPIGIVTYTDLLREFVAGEKEN
jgi:CBS domain-containing protein/predicted CoA-binding protein